MPPKTNEQRYIERNYQSGKVITPSFEETDVVSTRGAVITEIETQVGEPFSLYLTRVLSDLDIVANAAIDDRIIYVNCPVVPVVGNFVCLREFDHYYQGSILTVTATSGDNYTLEIDSPLDYDFTTDGGCSLTSNDLAVDGSATPVIFFISPQALTAGTVWDVHSVTAHIIHDVAMDETRFGGLPALTRGVVFRGVNGIVKNFGNFKSNGDFGDFGFASQYLDKAPAGFYAFRTNINIVSQYGSSFAMVSALVPTDSDFLQLINQDDLTDLDTFHVIVHGHIFTR